MYIYMNASLHHILCAVTVPNSAGTLRKSSNYNGLSFSLLKTLQGEGRSAAHSP